VEFTSVPDIGTRTVRNVWDGYKGGDPTISVAANNDGNGYGTHTSSTVGGQTAGVAPSANIFGVKVLSNSGSGSSSTIVAGMDYVASLKTSSPTTPMVVSMSFGGQCVGPCSSNDPLNTAISRLNSKGVIAVVAAGNSATDASRFTPAFSPSAITIGATDSSDKLAYYSNIGSSVDLLAPGSGVRGACADGTSGCTGNNNYIVFSGTSMACPHVSGNVALFMAQTGIHSPKNTDVIRGLQCAALRGVIGNVPVGTVNLMVQVPPPSVTDFTCPAPTQNPTLSPTRAPTVSKQPTPPPVPTRSPTPRPTPQKGKK
jgi:cerevisin